MCTATSGDSGSLADAKGLTVGQWHGGDRVEKGNGALREKS
jgi:hypothetical protein